MIYLQRETYTSNFTLARLLSPIDICFLLINQLEYRSYYF